MSNFGDIRSIVQAAQEDDAALVASLASYADTTPAHEVVAYIKRTWGWCPASVWRSRSGDHGRALLAHEYMGASLTAHVQVGDDEVEILRLVNAEDSVQAALQPMRKETLDAHWMPWAKARDTHESRLLTWTLYECAVDPLRRHENTFDEWAGIITLRPSPLDTGTEAAQTLARLMARTASLSAVAWKPIDVVFPMAWLDVRSDAAPSMDVALERIYARVDRVLLGGV